MSLRRREFLGATASAIAAACFPRVRSSGTREIDAAEFHASRRFARTYLGDIAYVERGTGDAALFLHGFPLNGFQWRGALARLGAHRRCIAPDFMGLGQTRVPPGQGLGPEAQLEMLLALMGTLSLPRVDLVASDSGGAIAQLFVAEYPECVRTLLLTNCDAENDSPPAAMKQVIEMAHAGTYPDRWLAPWLADKDLARSPSGLGGMTYTYPNHPSDEAIDCYLAPLLSSAERRAQVNAYAIALENNALAGSEPALKRCPVPTRIVWGTGDTIFSPATPDYLDRTLGSSRGVRRVPGARLFFPEEFPDLIAEEARGLWGVPRT